MVGLTHAPLMPVFAADEKEARSSTEQRGRAGWIRGGKKIQGCAANSFLDKVAAGSR